jgi:hypothetical protein
MINRAERYRNPANALAALVLLLCFAGYTLADSAYLMSNYCFDDTDQIVCPAAGPDWLRPLPSYAVLTAVVVGAGGVSLGRPARGPALAAGFLLVTIALITGRILAV